MLWFVLPFPRYWFDPSALSMKRIYIAGKVTGLTPEEYKWNFSVAENWIRENLPVRFISNPLKTTSHLSPHINTWEQYMVCCFEEILRCDAIFMLSNWRESKGARMEHAIAEELQYRIFYQDIVDSVEYEQQKLTDNC